jgi:hypothetical protein
MPAVIAAIAVLAAGGRTAAAGGDPPADARAPVTAAPAPIEPAPAPIGPAPAPIEPAPAPSPADSAPVTPSDPAAPAAPAASLPCGEPPEPGSTVLVICSTWRVAPSSAGDLYRDHASRRPRSGGMLGAAAISTLTPRMRRDGVEVLLGMVRDRRKTFGFLIRPLRGVLDGGEIDRGLELGFAFGVLAGRFHVGLEGNAVFGIAFEEEKLAFGLALVGQYELLASDSVALVATARLGFDSFEHEIPSGGTETRGDPLIAVGLGVNWFQVVR